MAQQQDKSAGAPPSKGNENHPAGKRSNADSKTGGDVPATYQPESGQPGERDPAVVGSDRQSKS